MSTLSIAQRLNKSWRIIATAGCFSLFGLGALFADVHDISANITTYTQSPATRNQSTKAPFNVLLIFSVAQCDFLKVIDYRFDNLIALKEDKHSLIVANHPSLIDYVLIASQLPQCDCLVKASIWRNPFIKGIVKAAGYIPNRDPESLLESCNQRLQQGNVLPDISRRNTYNGD